MVASLFLDNGSSTLRGPLEGGTAVTIVDDAEVYTDTSCDDDFAGAVIDGAKWTGSATGSGSTTQDDEIILHTGTTANSSAVLTSVPLFQEIGDYRIRFDIQTGVVAAPPINETRFFDFELFVDANNYFRVSRIFDPGASGNGHAFRITAVIGGSTHDELTVASNTRGATVRLVRIKSRIIVYVNSLVIYNDNPFLTATDAQIVYRAVNPDATNAYDFTTTLDDFVVSPLVLLDAEPGIIKRIATTSVRMESPVALLPTNASIEIHNCGGLVERYADVFAYFLETEFTILSAEGATVGIIGELTLRNPSTGVGFEV